MTDDPLQGELFHEDIYHAISTCISALGGAKRVGCVLWPALSADKAGNRLRDCLNPERREKLDIDQVLWVMAEARKSGCHAAMYFITDHCDYERPQPIEPESEMAKLQREYIQAVKSMGMLSRRMEHIAELPKMKAVG